MENTGKNNVTRAVTRCYTLLHNVGPCGNIKGWDVIGTWDADVVSNNRAEAQPFGIALPLVLLHG